MKQPKVYKRSLKKVFEVESIRFDTKVVEIMENTGFRDKNDNYIYTGDILEYQGEANIYYIRKLLVEKDGEEESYILTTDGIYVRRLMNMDDYLVIGNIYENKDLLED